MQGGMEAWMVGGGGRPRQWTSEQPLGGQEDSMGGFPHTPHLPPKRAGLGRAEASKVLTSGAESKGKLKIHSSRQITLYGLSF